MTYKQLKELKPEAFKRRCRLQIETFNQMVEILNPHLNRKGKRGGQCKLSVEDQLLVVLEYWREYRTQFHIGTSWSLSESAGLIYLAHQTVPNTKSPIYPFPLSPFPFPLSPFPFPLSPL